MFWNRRKELARAIQQRDEARAERDDAWERRNKLHDQFLSLVHCNADLSRRNPPSNRFKGVHTIDGREVVEAQDGSLWLRAGDEWLNWSLPDTSTPKEPSVSMAEHRAAIEVLRYLWMSGDMHREDARAMAAKVLDEYDAKEGDHV